MNNFSELRRLTTVTYKISDKYYSRVYNFNVNERLIAISIFDILWLEIGDLYL